MVDVEAGVLPLASAMEERERVPSEEEEKLLREAREKKACKDDKAPVPTQLWLEHLVNDGPTAWSKDQKESLDKAMDLARRYALRWWKKALVRCFQKWYRAKHKSHVKCAAAWTKKHGSGITFDPATRKYSWTPRFSTNPTGNTKKHKWSQGGKSGYHCWWLRRYKAREDHDAGRDTPHRGHWSSW